MFTSILYKETCQFKSRFKMTTRVYIELLNTPTRKEIEDETRFISPTACAEVQEPNSPSTGHTYPFSDEPNHVVITHSPNDDEELKPLMHSNGVRQPGNIQTFDIIPNEDKRTHIKDQVILPSEDIRHCSVNLESKSSQTETDDDSAHENKNLRKKRLKQCNLIFQLFMISLVLTFFVLSLYQMIEKHSAKVFDSFRNNAHTIAPKTMNLSRSVQSVTLNIDWARIQQEKPRISVNMSWVEHPSTLIHLENNARMIRVMRNGTYDIKMVLNLDVDAANGKRPVYQSLTCIKNNRSRPRCQKQKLLPKTAGTVQVINVIPLGEGDYIWVDIIGVDQIYRNGAGSYLIITWYHG